MAKSTIFPRHSTINCRGKILSFNQAVVMGILNVTPDSFYRPDAGTLEQLCERAATMLEEGATILDLGAMSSRPGALEIPAQEEMDRLLPLVELLAKNFPEAILSVDTYRSAVAKPALDAGVHILNDISGGMLDPELPKLAAQYQAPYICMHLKGTPATMQQEAVYEDLLLEIQTFFYQQLATLSDQGVIDIILDPGFGFAKTIAHNFTLLKNLSWLQHLHRPVLVGISRKSMIWKSLKSTPENALNGTTALHMLALEQGANILRVHDVRQAMECINLHRLYVNG